MKSQTVCLLLFSAAWGGCDGAGRAGNLLCAYCTDDSQCGGNPCFQDATGGRFCGSPCGAGCPAGYSCAGIYGSDAAKGAFYSCFPDNQSCLTTVGDGGIPNRPDGSGPPVTDGGKGGIPVGGQVGATGGTVDRLFFGISGDTRPDGCGGIYPQAIIDSIFTQLSAKGAEFVVDQGDHMFSCGFGTQAVADSRAHMASYVSAAQKFGKTVFMTMGNHECSGSSSYLCSTANSYGANPNYTAFMDALAPISSLPYYRVDIMTRSGKAVFLVVADDAWDGAQQSWLTTQLTDADATAKYTFVSKHHPDRNSDHPEFQQIYDLVRAHKYTLFLTGHSHLYKRQFGDPRALVMGIGGAPLAGSNYWGYGTVQQGLDDRIYVTVYDQATGNVMDQFDVAPQ